MQRTLLAGLDIGTTGSKAIIFTDAGEVLGSAYRHNSCTYPAHNWVEQDADKIVEDAVAAVKEAVELSGAAPEEIISISLSAQRSCSVFIDEHGVPLRPMISWQDNRGIEEVEEIAEKIGRDVFYSKTGFPLSTTWVLSKLLWVRKNEPEIFSKTMKVVQMHDYFLKALGVDDYLVDFNDAGFYGLFNSRTRIWDGELMSAFDVKPELLSEPRPSGTRAGTVSAAASVRTGLCEGTTIAVGAGDQSAGSLGSGVIKPGLVAVSLGTAGAVTAFSSESVRDPKGRNMVTNCTVPDFWLVEGFQAAAASVYEWYKDKLGREEAAEASASGRDVFEILNEKAGKSKPGAEGLMLLPYFASAGTPRYNADARGVLTGLTLAHDTRHLVRAFMEGITLDTYDMLVSLKKAGTPADEIIILGGPTKSELWNQIQADIYGLKVSTLKVSDAAVVGAAILGGLAAGVFNSFAEAVEKMVRKGRQYYPDDENHKIYENLYMIFCDAYEALDEKNIFSRLAGIQKGKN